MIIRAFDKAIGVIDSLKNLYLSKRLRYRIRKGSSGSKIVQNLEIYSNPNFEDTLNKWGKETVWPEIQYLMVNCKGRILDIGCGTGKVMSILQEFQRCDVYGCDISSFLVEKAIGAGIPRSRLVVCNATKMPYGNNYFDYSYSIGSLHVFTEEGIIALLEETYRVNKYKLFFQVPTSRKRVDEGWIRLEQSYFNNSVDWWLDKCRRVYQEVYVLDSNWEDPISLGKWFVCVKERNEDIAQKA